MRLLIASRNTHKLDEIRAIVDEPALQLLSLHDLPPLPVVVEDGDTFEANARKKACTLARAAGQWALADDSGLEVDALGGAPGVYSARYAGEPTDDAANNARLLAALDRVTQRRARFRCVLALADPSGDARTVAGACEGRIAPAPRGGNGFGYDPVFIPDGYTQTFAELPADVKNRISHRADALRRAVAAWRAILGGEAASWSNGA